MSNSYKNTVYVEANVVNISAKFQLHPPYGFWEEEFLLGGGGEGGFLRI